MFPHERSLVKRLADKPFVLLGVNSDKTREDVKEKNEKESITWRSFFDGGSTGGPIATQYAVQGWPTLYVLDAKGVIRHKWVGSPGDKVMDEAIDKLLEETDGASKK
jgi:AhpC/TSA family